MENVHANIRCSSSVRQGVSLSPRLLLVFVMLIPGTYSQQCKKGSSKINIFSDIDIETAYRICFRKNLDNFIDLKFTFISTSVKVEFAIGSKFQNIYFFVQRIQCFPSCNKSTLIISGSFLLLLSNENIEENFRKVHVPTSTCSFTSLLKSSTWKSRNWTG